MVGRFFYKNLNIFILNNKFICIYIYNPHLISSLPIVPLGASVVTGAMKVKQEASNPPKGCFQESPVCYMSEILCLFAHKN
jgi:hypothetical protein